MGPPERTAIPHGTPWNDGHMFNLVHPLKGRPYHMGPPERRAILLKRHPFGHLRPKNSPFRTIHPKCPHLNGPTCPLRPYMNWSQWKWDPTWGALLLHYGVDEGHRCRAMVAKHVAQWHGTLMLEFTPMDENAPYTMHHDFTHLYH